MYSFGGQFFCQADFHAQPCTLVLAVHAQPCTLVLAVHFCCQNWFWQGMFVARSGSGCYPLAARTSCLMLLQVNSVLEGGRLCSVRSRTAAYCCSSGLPELLDWQNCAA